MGPLLAIVSLVLLLLQVVLIARAVLDWSVALAGPAAFGSVRFRLTTGVRAVTEPILAPVRRLVPPLRVGGMAIDLAFIIVFFAIVLLRTFI
jgi:YggT family protein